MVNSSTRSSARLVGVNGRPSPLRPGRLIASSTPCPGMTETPSGLLTMKCLTSCVTNWLISSLTLWFMAFPLGMDVLRCLFILVTSAVVAPAARWPAVSAIKKRFAMPASAVSGAGRLRANEGGHHGTQIHRLQGIPERDGVHGHDFRRQRKRTDRSRRAARCRGAQGTWHAGTARGDPQAGQDHADGEGSLTRQRTRSKNGAAQAVPFFRAFGHARVRS